MNIEKILKVEPTPEDRATRRRSHIFLWDTDHTIVDMLTNRTDRKLEDFVDLIPVAIEVAKLKGATKFTFHNKVCTCGASPGFDADGWLTDDSGTLYDLHITYSGKKILSRPDTENVAAEDSGSNENEGETIELSSGDNSASIGSSARQRRLAVRQSRRDNTRQLRSKIGDQATQAFAAKRKYTRKVAFRNLPQNN